MEVKLQPDVQAAVEINGEMIVNFDNSEVYFASLIEEEIFLYIKSTDGKEVKIRFLKK